MEPCATRRSRRIFEWILIAAFAASLAYPSLDMQLRPNVKHSTKLEFRNPAKRPDLPQSLEQWLGYPQGFDAWWNDHFGLRDKLVRWHNLRDWYVFGVSPTSKLVLGKGAWIYHTDDRTLDISRGIYPLSAREVDGWRRTLTARRDWLAARNIRYLFVFVPNKDQVYPEHLPRALQIGGLNRLDQLLAGVNERFDVDVLDLRPALVAEKKNDREDDYVYYRLGSHWTDRGAYAAYTSILERLKVHFPLLTPIPRDAFDVVARGQGDTWAPQLYMEDLLPQKALKWRLSHPGRARFDAGAVAGADAFESTNADASLPRAYILHDSFGPTLRPWLAENFSHAWWAWGWSFESEVARIQEVQPDVLIELFVDRLLVNQYPQVTGAEGKGPRRRAFRASSDVLLRLEGESLRARVRPYGKAELLENADASDPRLTLRCHTPTDGVLTPAISFPPEDDVIVEVEIEAPAMSGLDLFFQKEDEPGFDRRRVCSEKLNPGSNRVYFRLFADRLDGRMFLRLRTAGTYSITSIEVRAVHD